MVFLVFLEVFRKNFNGEDGSLVVGNVWLIVKKKKKDEILFVVLIFFLILLIYVLDCFVSVDYLWYLKWV